MGGRIGAAEGGRRAAPKAEKPLFGGSPPPSIFFHWGHVTRPHNIFSWVFRLLCVTMTYGLGVGRSGASGARSIVHNVHLCSNLAEIPNVIYIYVCRATRTIYTNMYIYISIGSRANLYTHIAAQTIHI